MVIVKLRWVTKKNRVKAVEIKEYFHNHHCRWLQEAKDILENVEGPILQYFDEATELWEDVPEVLEYRN